MSDPIAAALAMVLALTALAGYSARERLQPSRAGVLAYAAGAITWGIALFMLWFAWATADGPAPGCAQRACDELGSALETALDQIPGDLFLGADVLDAAQVTD